jgi:hypothetical protein
MAITEKRSYQHWGKPYRHIGKIPTAYVEVVKQLLAKVCGNYGGTDPEPRKLEDGGIRYYIDLFRLREDDGIHQKINDKEEIRKIAEQMNFKQLSELLLTHEPEDNYFIISPEGDLFAILW